MQRARSFQLVLLFLSLAVTLPSAVAQVTFATVPAGNSPYAVAVNSATNKTYVANYSDGTVTVIDGATNNTATVNVGVEPYAVAVNSMTNKIYVANNCGSDPSCMSAGTVTVIDGMTNNIVITVTVGNFPNDVEVNSVKNRIYSVDNCGGDNSCNSAGTVTVIDGKTNTVITAVTVGFFPYFAAVNSVTNQIYAANNCGSDVTCNSLGTVTDIDGVTNNTATVSVGAFPYLLAVDSATNEIYVPNYYGNDLTGASAGTVTVINGATNNTVPVAVGDNPYIVAVNPTTDTIYVGNYTDGTVSAIAGDTALQFVNVTPCRLVDTRLQFGGIGPILGGTYDTFNLPQAAQQSMGCPMLNLSSAAAYSLNVTLVPDQGTPVGYLTIWPAGETTQPVISTTNSVDGRVKANAAIVPAGVSGGVNVFLSNTADVLLDIDGYFTLTSANSTLAFYTLTPCRVADTRANSGFPQGLGPPYLSGGTARQFPILSSNCIPPGASPQAYSFNFTVLPYEPLGYLTVWPFGQSQPVVSTLNSVTGTVVANAAIVPAGTDPERSIESFASSNTDLLIDINGYFAPAGGQNPLSLYPAVPCRVLDTRQVGNGQPFVDELTVDVVDSVCGPSALAQAYVHNATVVPSVPLGYLTLWPDGGSQPVVSTLNAVDGAITSNMAIVPTNKGKIDAFASNLTQLILDISAYFAPIPALSITTTALPSGTLN